MGPMAEAAMRRVGRTIALGARLAIGRGKKGQWSKGSQRPSEHPAKAGMRPALKDGGHVLGAHKITPACSSRQCNDLGKL
jgi:hypothetical protein